VLAAVLATGATQSAEARPVVVTTTEILARLLPAGAALHGLDPDGTSYDGERLIVLSDAAAAVTHAEEEMIVRRRLLDTFDLDSITALNERTDHAETQPPYVLLIDATPRHAARLHAVGAHRAALHLHPVILGELDGIPTADAAGVARPSTLAADDLAAVLIMLTDATARPEPGHDIDLDPASSHPAAAPHEVSTEPDEPVPAQPSETLAPVWLRVLGPVLVETETGAVATGMRSGSYTVLASLAAHPGGRTLDQLAADLHPNTTPSTAGKRIRTDISTTRRVLRAATGNAEAMFVVYDPATGRYHLDPELIAVDLWQMLTAIEAANTATDDTRALALLRRAAELYGGDFADGADLTWITDYATTYRHQVLSVLARIAELLEADHPDQAVTALERALEFDPVNEELYQRIMRIHGRAGRADAVRRTLRRLEDRLADLGGAEPSEATRRVAERQLRPATASGGHR
jgi:DNA-binding SARP family transcriptional activator